MGHSLCLNVFAPSKRGSVSDLIYIALWFQLSLDV